MLPIVRRRLHFNGDIIKGMFIWDPRDSKLEILSAVPAKLTSGQSFTNRWIKTVTATVLVATFRLSFAFASWLYKAFRDSIGMCHSPGITPATALPLHSFYGVVSVHRFEKFKNWNRLKVTQRNSACWHLMPVREPGRHRPTRLLIYRSA